VLEFSSVRRFGAYLYLRVVDIDHVTVVMAYIEQSLR
jgi:hypothetical protein